MESGQRTRPDLLAALAVVLTVATGGLYLGLILGEESEIAWWFLAGLAVAAVLAGYGAMRGVRRRSNVLMLSAGILLVLGVLTLPTIGLLLVVASVLALVAAARARREVQTGS